MLANTNQPQQQLQLPNPTCPECGDLLHPMANFCPRCLVPIFPDPDATEEIREIAEPEGAFCFILMNNSVVTPLLARPNPNSRRLFIMTGKDVVLIRGEVGEFYKVRAPGGVEGYV